MSDRVAMRLSESGLGQLYLQPFLQYCPRNDQAFNPDFLLPHFRHTHVPANSLSDHCLCCVVDFDHNTHSGSSMPAH